MGKSYLKDSHPEIALMLNFEASGLLSSDEITTFSNRVFHWDCANGHSFTSKAVSLVRKKLTICPICAAEEKANKSSLVRHFPNLESEWLESKNGKIQINISFNSKRKAWWLCAQKHEWEASISNRAVRGSRCPYCSGRKIGYGNDLASTHPSIVAKLDKDRPQIDPTTIGYGTKKKLWWKCEVGHSWDATPNDRINGKGCPYCLNRRFGQGNDLVYLFPDLAAEWITLKNGFPPSEQVSGTHFEAWWRCAGCGLEWKRDVKGRVDGAGCPDCGQKRARENRNQQTIELKGNLLDNFPIIVDEWDSARNLKLPTEFTAGSGKVVWWLCSRGHSYQLAIKDRTKENGIGCPKCHGNTSRLEIRTLVELRSVFGEMEWRERLDGFEADIWSKKYGFVVEVDGFPWHAGNENRDTLKNEHFRKHGLDTFRLRDYRLKAIGSNDVPFCSDASEKKTFHDALKLLVIKIINSRKFPKRVKCIADSYVNSDSFFDDASYREMLVYLKGPPPSKDLETLFPEIASEWSARNPMKPSQMYPYSSERVLFVCPHGHEYEQIINVRTGMGTNCPICSNRRVLQGYNDLESKCPLIANEWSGKNDISPSEVVWTSRKKVFWDCPKCGKEYMGVIRNRTQKQSGCASCSKKKSCAKRKLTKK